MTLSIAQRRLLVCSLLGVAVVGSLFVAWEMGTEWSSVSRGRDKQAQSQDDESERQRGLPGGRMYSLRERLLNESDARGQNADGEIALTLVDAGHEPVPDVSGSLYRSGARLSKLVAPVRFVTDRAGQARISVTPGRWVLRVSADPEGYRKLNVQANRTVPVYYVLKPGICIVGMVVDTNGQEVAGASVEVTAFGSNSVRMPIGKTNSDGTFRHRIQGRECVVVARGDGFATAFEHIYAEHSEAGEEVHTRLVLQPATEIRGVVQDHLGQPVGGCTILAGTISDLQGWASTLTPDVESVTSDSNGVFVLGKLSAGQNIVRAMAPGFVDWHKVIVTRLREPQQCLIQLSPAARVFGVVQSKNAALVQNAVVTCYRGMTLASTVTTDEKGRFEFNNLAPGECVCWVYHATAGWAEFSRHVVAGDAVSGFVVTLASGVPVRGRVVDERGWPLSEVQGVARARDSDGRLLPWSGLFLTERDGQFEIQNVDRRLSLWISGAKTGYAHVRKRFAVDAAIELVMRRIRLDTTLVGRVVSSDGSFQPGVLVAASAPGMSGAPASYTDGKGRFTVSGVSRGPALITLSKKGFAYTHIRHVVTKGGRQDVGELMILQGGTVALRVACDALPSIKGLATLIRLDGRAVTRFQVVDNHGTSCEVPPGDYRVHVMSKTCESKQVPVKVSLGRQAQVTMTLRQGRLVRLKCHAPPELTVTDRLSVTLARGNEVIEDYSKRMSARSHCYTILVGIGDGRYRLTARTGRWSAVAEFQYQDIPLRNGKPQLDIHLAAK